MKQTVSAIKVAELVRLYEPVGVLSLTRLLVRITGQKSWYVRAAIREAETCGFIERTQNGTHWNVVRVG